MDSGHKSASTADAKTNDDAIPFLLLECSLEGSHALIHIELIS